MKKSVIISVIFSIMATLSCGKIEQPIMNEIEEPTTPIPNAYSLEMEMANGELIVSVTDAKGDLDLDAYISLNAELRGIISIERPFRGNGEKTVNETIPSFGGRVHAVKGESISFNLEELYTIVNTYQYYEFCYDENGNMRYSPFIPKWNELALSGKVIFKRTYNQVLKETTNAVFGHDWETPQTLHDPVECDFTINFKPDSQLQVESCSIIINGVEMNK